ncbi:MAG: glycine cleavage system protein GcvH [Gaiellaceae bacterium]
MTPTDRRYTPEHQWIRADSPARWLVGVTDFAQSQLGEITSVELPAAGMRLQAAEPFGVVESLKAASDLFAPVAGTVVEANAELTATPEALNDDPYGTWLIAIAPADPAELATLLTADQYDEIAR